LPINEALYPKRIHKYPVKNLENWAFKCPRICLFKETTAVYAHENKSNNYVEIP